jgi:phosphate transport system permease protein
MKQAPSLHLNKQDKKRWAESLGVALFQGCTYAVLGFAIFVLGKIVWEGSKTLFSKEFPWVNIEFLTQAPETLHIFEYKGEEKALGERAFREFIASHNLPEDWPSVPYVYCAGGILPNIIGTILLAIGAMILALVLGIISAIYLSEYGREGRFIRGVRLAIVNLAGVPSIVFGLFGYGLFVTFMPVIAAEPNPDRFHISLPAGLWLNFQGWGTSILAGWFTLAFMVLPIVITSVEEALKAVPKGFREGALALGATRWQTIWTNVLPYAWPGILTSSILSLARVAGETAPIMFTAAFVMRDRLPWQVDHWSHFFFQGVTTLPYHIYTISMRLPPNEYTHRMQYATAMIFVLLILLVIIVTTWLRSRARSQTRW